MGAESRAEKPVVPQNPPNHNFLEADRKKAAAQLLGLKLMLQHS